jgi:hypothetical protein
MVTAWLATSARQRTSVCGRASRCSEVMRTHLRSRFATAAIDPTRPRVGQTRVVRTRRRRRRLARRGTVRFRRHQLQAAVAVPERMRAQQEQKAGFPVAPGPPVRAEAVEAQAMQARAVEVRAARAEARPDRTPRPAAARPAAAIRATVAAELEREPVVRAQLRPLGPRLVAATVLLLSAAMEVVSISLEIHSTVVHVAMRAPHRIVVRPPAARARAS